MRTTKEIIETIHKQTNFTKEFVEDVVSKFIDTLHQDIIMGRTVYIHKLGKFKPVVRKERVGFIPKKKEKIIIPARLHPQFKFSSSIKEAFNS